MATGEDFRWSTTVGGKPDPITKMTQRYFDQVFKLITNTPDVYRKFLAVVHMLEPPTTLFQPSILAKVLWQTIRTKRSTE